MYRPEAFKEDRHEILLATILDIQLAAIVTTTELGIEVTHAPMVAREDNEQLRLECHMARVNPHWQSAQQPNKSIAIFQGPHAYVSPSWYPTKAKNGKVVPTWAYIAVHAYGRLEVVDDQRWLKRHLNSLTDANESSREKPWRISDAPEEYLARMSKGIVGLALTVEHLEGVWKINQHKGAADREGTRLGLANSGSMGKQLADSLGTNTDLST